LRLLSIFSLVNLSWSHLPGNSGGNRDDGRNWVDGKNWDGRRTWVDGTNRDDGFRDWSNSGNWGNSGDWNDFGDWNNIGNRDDLGSGGDSNWESHSNGGAAVLNFLFLFFFFGRLLFFLSLVLIDVIHSGLTLILLLLSLLNLTLLNLTGTNIFFFIFNFFFLDLTGLTTFVFSFLLELLLWLSKVLLLGELVGSGIAGFLDLKGFLGELVVALRPGTHGDREKNQSEELHFDFKISFVLQVKLNSMRLRYLLVASPSRE
jgi:hypothetical protein